MASVAPAAHLRLLLHGHVTRLASDACIFPRLHVTVGTGVAIAPFETSNNVTAATALERYVWMMDLYRRFDAPSDTASPTAMLRNYTKDDSRCLCRPNVPSMNLLTTRLPPPKMPRSCNASKPTRLTTLSPFRLRARDNATYAICGSKM